MAVNGGSSGFFPLTSLVGSNEAEHCSVAPPLLPPQLQLQGPLPVTPEALPTSQRLVIGAFAAATPLADPQTPLTACLGLKMKSKSMVSFLIFTNVRPPEMNGAVTIKPTPINRDHFDAVKSNSEMPARRKPAPMLKGTKAVSFNGEGGGGESPRFSFGEFLCQSAVATKRPVKIPAAACAPEETDQRFSPRSL